MSTLKTQSQLDPKTFLTKWSFRSFPVLLLVVAALWLDRVKDRWYIFDPVELNVLARDAIASHLNNTTAMIQHIVANLSSTYPANHVEINLDSDECMLNTARGAMGAMYIVHASITEYIFIIGTPLGTEGHTGMHPADDYFNILVGEQWELSPGQLEMERYTAGTAMVASYPEDLPSKIRGQSVRKTERTHQRNPTRNVYLCAMRCAELWMGLTARICGRKTLVKATLREMGSNILVRKYNGLSINAELSVKPGFTLCERCT